MKFNTSEAYAQGIHFNHLSFVELFLNQVIEPGMFCCDATAGNGHDSLRLSNLVGKEGHVISFDIQDIAIKRTEILLTQKSDHRNWTLIHDSHENMGKYIDFSLDALIFNFGYLPGGDKSITTQTASSLSAVKTGFHLLRRGGWMILTVYPGHMEGHAEAETLNAHFKSIPQKSAEIFGFEYLNSDISAPKVYCLKKLL